MSASRHASYATVQMLRGFAASAVVLFHLLPFEHKYLSGPAIGPDFLLVGQAGVDVFFVISGFIVATVSTGHSGRLRDSLNFLVRRCWRIYPTYWVYFGLLLAIYLTAPQLMNQGAAGSPSLLNSFFLLPGHSPPLLLVAWTLSFELYFYLVYALMLYVVGRSRLAGVLLAWAVLVVIGRLLVGSSGSPLLDLVFNPLNLEFITGCAIALIAPHISRGFGIVLLLGGVLLAAMLLWLIGVAAPFANIWLRVGIFGSVAAFIVAGCAAYEVPGRTIVPRPLVRVGDASYSLYLAHLLTIGAMGQVWHRLLAMAAEDSGVAIHIVALLSTFGASLCVGWVSFRLIESPLAGMIRHRGLVPVPTKSAGEVVAV